MTLFKLARLDPRGVTAQEFATPVTVTRQHLLSILKENADANAGEAEDGDDLDEFVEEDAEEEDAEEEDAEEGFEEEGEEEKSV